MTKKISMNRFAINIHYFKLGSYEDDFHTRALNHLKIVLSFQSPSSGPIVRSTDAMNPILHMYEVTIVIVIRNANLKKNCSVQSQSIEPESTVVIAEAVIEMPSVASEYCVRSPRVRNLDGAST